MNLDHQGNNGDQMFGQPILLKQNHSSVNLSNPLGVSQSINNPSSQLYSYAVDKVIGQGAFSSVYLATIQETGEKVAIKKALQEKKYKNREYLNYKILNEHPNIVHLKSAFYIVGQNNEDVYINFVMEYLPESLYAIIKSYRKQKKQMPNAHLKLFGYQMLRALSYINCKGLAHRDLKPANILVDQTSMVAKIGDFGSAKVLEKGQTNTSYLCARYYRAPELIFGAVDYTTAIDTWSLGCIFAEMILLEPLFPGESSVDQLVEIMKVLGTPTQQDIADFNVNSNNDFKFPQVKAHPWSKVFLKYKPDIQFVDLIKRMIVYSPSKRIKPFEAMLHSYFDDVRDQNLPEGVNMPSLWKMTKGLLLTLINNKKEEMSIYGIQGIKQLVPEQFLNISGIK